MVHRHAPTRVPRRIRVLCVDDSRDITEVTRMVLDLEPRMQCVGCLASADQLLETIRQLEKPPDVILLDATMPGKSPLEALRELAAEFTDIRTIIYSGYDDPVFMDHAQDAGAWGCVSKSDQPDTILQAIREVAAGNVWWPRTHHRG